MLAVLAWSERAGATCIEHPFSSMGPRLSRVATPVPLVMLGGALVAPLVMAPAGVDQDVRVFFQKTLGGRYDAERASVVAPYSLAAALAVGYTAGLLVSDCASTALLGRSLQAVGIAFFVETAAKYIVGRTYPAGNPYAENRLVDDGRSTRLQAFSGAGAWPSGHAATTFAFAAVLRTALPAHLGVVRYGGYLLATLVSAGMLYGDHHWASDIVSGALIGEAIGRSVGLDLAARAPSSSTITLVPMGAGMALIGNL